MEFISKIIKKLHLNKQRKNIIIMACRGDSKTCMRLDYFMKTVYPEEKGSIKIQDHNMRWTLRRSKGESCFGINGSRIFELSIYKDDVLVLLYMRGYSRKPDKSDEATQVCLKYLLDKFGKEKRKEKKMQNE